MIHPRRYVLAKSIKDWEENCFVNIIWLHYENCKPVVSYHMPVQEFTCAEDMLDAESKQNKYMGLSTGLIVTESFIQATYYAHHSVMIPKMGCLITG